MKRVPEYAVDSHHWLILHGRYVPGTQAPLLGMRGEQLLRLPAQDHSRPDQTSRARLSKAELNVALAARSALRHRMPARRTMAASAVQVRPACRAARSGNAGQVTPAAHIQQRLLPGFHFHPHLGHHPGGAQAVIHQPPGSEGTRQHGQRQPGRGLSPQALAPRQGWAGFTTSCMRSSNKGSVSMSSRSVG